jgi:PAS domain S-box-containing protein
MRVRPLGTAVTVAAAYFVTARFGFEFAFEAEQVTTVWAPTGIAIAALVLWGRTLWPAVWIAAFAANAGTQAPLWTAGAIATGNTLEAVFAAFVLRRMRTFDPRFRKLYDALAFVAAGAIVSPTISATVGVLTLSAAGVEPWARFIDLWAHWWLGDALGALVVGPVILTLAHPPRTWRRRQLVEAGLILGATIMTTHVVFGQPLGSAVSGHPLEFVIFPLVITAAVRLQTATTSLVVLATSAVTIWHTVRGAGPFSEGDVHQSLVLLQTFMGVLAATSLVLASAIAERITSERRRAAAYAVGATLSTAATLADAAPEILERIAVNLEWQFGGFWVVDRHANRMRCLAVWTDSATPSTEAFAEASRNMSFPRGIGLPGRVWASGEPAWVVDVVRDSNFPRAAVAERAGFHGAFAFPIALGQEVIGVVECFHRTALSLDTDLLGTMSTVGNQIGQFVGRTRGEAAVMDEQRLTRAILETALDAIIGMDHEGRVTGFNPAAERMFGYPARDVVGRDLADLLIPTDLRERHRGGLRRHLATGDGGFLDRRVETTARHVDGHDFPVELSVTRVAGEHPPRFTGFVRDLTARAEAERERELLLQRELHARREAEAANRAKDEFLATLSHELRTPLNAIVGWTRMLIDGGLDPDGVRKALQVIDRNAQAQTQLVADILDVSRIITGGLRLNVGPVQLETIVSAALDAVRPAANAKGVRLTSRLALATSVHQGDPERLQQIVWNLLTNAVKFTPPGGSVHLALEPGDEGSVRIRVEDNGAGIEPAFLPHVFERFRQADGSMSRRHGGLGLGLAIVRHLVELHGGRVYAESAGPGLGSTFTVDLPQADTGRPFPLLPGHGQPSGQSSISTLSLDGCRALVVDDDPDARDLVAAILKASGASVQTAASAVGALQQLEGDEFDVLLADLGMAGTDGYAFIREVRRREAEGARRLPAAAVTAYASADDRVRVLSAGFDAHIAKPVDPALVVEIVHALWRVRI